MRRCKHLQGSYGSLKSMKLQVFVVVKTMYLNVLNFQKTVEKSLKVHIKRVLLLIKNYVYYFADASFEAIVCKKIFCGDVGIPAGDASRRRRFPPAPLPAGAASRWRLPIVSRQPIDRLHALEHEASRSGSRVCTRETSAAAEHLL